jgi:hypothetical protein
MSSAQEVERIRTFLLKGAMTGGCPVRVKIAGGSMWPFLKDGQEVDVCGKSMEDVRPGDIVLAQIDGRVICHRVFSKKRGILTTKADALPVCDPYRIGPQEYLGKVVALSTGRFLMKMDTPWAAGVGLAISRLTLLVPHFFPLLRYFRKIFMLRLVR